MTNPYDGDFGSDVMADLYPPENAARMYVAALLWSDDVVSLLHRSIVEPKHLDHEGPEYGLILETMLAMLERGDTITQLTVATEVGPRLEPLVWSCTTMADPAYVALYAEQVMRRYRRRVVADSGSTLTTIAATAVGADMEKQVEWTLNAMAAEQPAVRAVASLADGLDALLDGGDDPIPSFPTPWPSLTSAIDGFRGGSLYTLSGETGSGKSAIALQMAYEIATRGKVLYASMEMPRAEVQLRVVAQQTEISSKLLEHRRVPPGPVQERLAAWRWSSHLGNLIVNDDTSLTIGDLRRLALGIDGVSAVFVDQLSLMNHEGQKGENESTTLARTTQALKNLAMDLDIPVVLLTQVNREGAKAIRPTRNHLFGSSGISNAADVVLILWREDPNVPRDLKMLIDKNRQGQEGYVRLDWEGQFFRAYSPGGAA